MQKNIGDIRHFLKISHAVILFTCVNDHFWNDVCRANYAIMSAIFQNKACRQ